MNSNWTEHKYLKAILKKMCYMVNADFYSIDFANPNDPYFKKYSWTKEQEDSFIDWMTNFLYEDSKARRELMNWPRKAKKYCRKVAEELCWNHGWILKDK